MMDEGIRNLDWFVVDDALDGKHASCCGKHEKEND